MSQVRLREKKNESPELTGALPKEGSARGSCLPPRAITQQPKDTFFRSNVHCRHRSVLVIGASESVKDIRVSVTNWCLHPEHDK